MQKAALPIVGFAGILIGIGLIVYDKYADGSTTPITPTPVAPVEPIKPKPKPRPGPFKPKPKPDPNKPNPDKPKPKSDNAPVLPWVQIPSLPGDPPCDNTCPCKKPDPTTQPPSTTPGEQQERTIIYRRRR